MSEFNFKSQICTDKIQSERLLSLGLKKETADCCYLWHWESDSHSLYAASWEGLHRTTSDIPAWSLHRLWELLDKIKKYEGEDELLYPRISLVDGDVIFESPKSIWARRNFCSPKGAYENIINCFEELIKEGYFPKEYLV